MTTTVVIQQPSAVLTANFIYNESVKCYGESTGSIKYQGAGGVYLHIVIL